MKNKTLRAGLCLCLCLLLAAAAPVMYAHAENVYISFSDPTVEVGRVVTVNVMASVKVSELELELEYDAGYLEFQDFSGGLGNGNVQAENGTILLKDHVQSGADLFAMELRFKSLQVGKTTVKPVSCSVKDGGGESMDVSCGMAEVTVSAGPADATLRLLSVEPGELKPEFDPQVTEYTVQVDENTLFVMVTARANDGGAMTYVEGHDKLEIGRNRVTVTVTARDGGQNVYVIQVIRGEEPAATPAPTPTEAPEEAPEATPEPTPAGPAWAMVPDGSRMEIGEVPEDRIPGGFLAAEIRFDGRELSAIRSRDGEWTAVWLLTNGSNDEGFYYFDADTGTARPLCEVLTWGQSYTVLDAAQYDGAAPEGCVLGTYALTGRDDCVFLPTAAGAEYVVFYGEAEGVRGLYQYDLTEGTVQRCGLAVPEAREPAVDTAAAEAAEAAAMELQRKEAELAAAEKQATTMRRWAEAATVTAMVFLVCGVALVLLLRKSRQNDQPWP